METLKIDIVSPSGQLLVDKSASTLVLPAVEGEITVLPGHIDIVCLIGRGSLKLDDEKKYMIYKGIMEISNGTKVVVAAERVVQISELNKQEIITSVKEIEEKLLKETLGDQEFDQLYQLYQDRLAELNALN